MSTRPQPETQPAPETSTDAETTRRPTTGAPMTFAPDNRHPITGFFDSESHETPY